MTPAPSVDRSAPEPSPAFHLEGIIPARPMPPAYRLTLLLTAFAMVLLPLVYVALIVAAGWGVGYYAIHGIGVLSATGSGFIGIVAYLGPLAAGAILITFMIKPLFAPRAAAPDPLVLDLDREPKLRDLITAICTQVRAPLPAQVNLDCQVNASASLRRGLLSLGRRDLALTIGLPLAANLTARQLAGVLAHEFGHFAQGGGMTLTYIIRSINGWFARVVFERDRWDRQLEQWAANADARIALVLHAGRGAVWGSRKILHGLMYVGHVITCLQLRQMEFDADYYETHVAGSADFQSTSLELGCIGVTAQAAFNELGGLWNRRRLVDDYPGFVALRRTQLKPAIAEKIAARQQETATGWLDTHPGDRDRIAHARGLARPGIFRGEGPAAALFADFPALCREASTHFYRHQLGLAFEESALVPAAAAAHAGDEQGAIDAARTRLVGSVADLTRPLVWQEADFAPPTAPVAADPIVRQLAVLRAELARLRNSAEATNRIYGRLREDLDQAAGAHAFIFAGIKVKPEVFKIAKSELPAAAQRVTELNRALAARAAELAPFERAVTDWVRTVVQAARHPAVRSRLPEDLVARINLTAGALVALAPWFENCPRWLGDQALINLYAANAGALSRNERFNLAFDLHRTRTQALVDQAIGLIGDTPYPFPDPNAEPTVLAALRKSLHGVSGNGRVVVVLRFIVACHFRLLGQMAAAGETVEKLLTEPPVTPT